jgi:hypothetical protein
MSTFQPSIPIGTNLLSVDYKNIQQNFQQLDTSFGVNHVPFSVTPNNGLHTFVQMPVQSVPTILMGQGAVYTNTATAISPTNQSQLFYTADSASKAYQLTRCSDANYTLFSTLVNNYNAVGTAYSGGWTFLPGGILMQYGLYNAGGGGLGSSGTIKFPVAFTNNPYIVLPVLIAKTGGTGSVHTVSVISGTVNTTQFQWNLDSSTTAQTGIYWTAIGV